VYIYIYICTHASHDTSTRWGRLAGIRNAKKNKCCGPQMSCWGKNKTLSFMTIFKILFSVLDIYLQAYAGILRIAFFKCSMTTLSKSLSIITTKLQVVMWFYVTSIPSSHSCALKKVSSFAKFKLGQTCSKMGWSLHMAIWPTTCLYIIQNIVQYTQYTISNLDHYPASKLQAD
jgi:hypothetical protein